MPISAQKRRIFAFFKKVWRFVRSNRLMIRKKKVFIGDASKNRFWERGSTISAIRPSNRSDWSGPR